MDSGWRPVVCFDPVPVGSASLLAADDLSFDFARWTIVDAGGDAAGSLRWRRRPGTHLAVDLGFLDPSGDLVLALRPDGRWGPWSGTVLDPGGEAVGRLAVDALVLGERQVGVPERQRHAYYLPAWRLVGDEGVLADVRRELRWVGDEVARRELWHVRPGPAATGPGRMLAAAAPYACWRWYLTT